jgi:hypothetical protein
MTIKISGVIVYLNTHTHTHTSQLVKMELPVRTDLKE